MRKRKALSIKRNKVNSHPNREPSNKREMLSLLLIFLISFALRIFYLFEIRDTFAFSMLLGDAQLFDTWAKEISQSGWLGNEVFFQAPLYPYFLAIIYSVFGHNLIIVRLIQIILGSVSCVLVAKAGRNFFSKPVGMLSGFILAIYPPAIFFDCLIQKESLALFFMAFILFILGKMTDRVNIRRMFLMGTALGLLCLLRENALVLMPIIPVWLFIQFGRNQKKRDLIIWIISFILGIVIILIPVGVRNKVVGNEFVLTTTNFGLNFYIGNNRQATGTYVPVVPGHGDCKFERQDATDVAEKAVGHKLNPSEVSRYWLQKAISDIKPYPVSWIRLLFKKWLLVWNFVEISDAESIYAHEDWSFILRTLGYLLHFGVICPLAILGLYLTKEEFKKTWHLFLILISYAASISLFFVFARFRHPMTAIIILYAAAGLVYLIDLFNKKKFVAVFIGLCLLIISGVIVNWKMLPWENCSSDTYYNIGASLEQQGNVEESIKYYQTALKLNPDNVMAHNNIGILLYKKGDTDEALSHFEHALRIDPTLAETHNNIGIILFNLGKLYDALNHFESVIRINPAYNPSIYYNIACVHARLNNIEESIAWLRKATDLGYDKWDVIKTDKDLGNIRSSEGYEEIIKNH